MSGTNEELDVAREALLRARDDLARQLDAEPAWRALQQLEAREASPDPAAGIDFEAIRSNLLTRLDTNVPRWRTLAGIDAAIAALGPDQPAEDAVTPKQVPHSRIEAERTRYTSQSRPAPAARQSPSRRSSLPDEPAPAKRPAPTSLPPPPRRQTPSAGGRLAAALGLANEGPARLSAIESEVERLMRRDASTWNKLPATSPPPPVRYHPLPVEPAEDLPAYGEGEEAEVEIIQLTPISPRDERRPITRLAERLNRVDHSADGDTDAEPVISMHAHMDEASVEIDAAEPADPVPAPQHNNDAPET